VSPLTLPFSQQLFKHLVIKGSDRLMWAVGGIAGMVGFHGNPYRKVGLKRRKLLALLRSQCLTRAKASSRQCLRPANGLTRRCGAEAGADSGASRR
jgi:hypothetical protein